MPDACMAERALHGALLDDPRQPVAPGQISAIADEDARENWQWMISWRDHLVRHATLEAAYLAIVRRGLKFPRIFLDQLVQVILRNILDDCDDAFVLRAAELFFRPQKLALSQGSLLAADEETVTGFGAKPLTPLVSMLGLPVAAELDVLNEANGESYWARSDSFDMALDLTAGRRGLAALGDVVMRWVRHLLAVDVEIDAVTELRDARPPGMSVWTPMAPKLETPCGTATSWIKRPGSRVRPVSSELRRRFGNHREGERRADLSDRGHVEQQDGEVEASEPHHRAAGLASHRSLELSAQSRESASTARARIRVGVVVERHKAKSPWLDFLCRPVSVLAGVPAAAPWTVIDSEGDVTTFYAGDAVIELHRSEQPTTATILLREAPSCGSFCAPLLGRSGSTCSW